MPMAVDITGKDIDNNNNNNGNSSSNNNNVTNEEVHGSGGGEVKDEEVKEVRLSPYERLVRDLAEDERCIKEFGIGKRIGFYRMRNDIGSGNFAKVKLGFHCLVKEKVAIKILDKRKLDDKTRRLLSQEISSMEKLAHPIIIRIFEVLETLSHVHIVCEYATAGELFHKIVTDGKFAESTAKRYYAQILSAVTYMHHNNIIHRDIKAENVFLSGGNTCKLGDFGFSTIVSSPDEHLNTFCGSPPYAAPELFKDDYYLGKHVDIWALGILLFFMTTGSMPFRADTVGKLKRKILEGAFNIPDHVTPALRFLISHILKLLPKDRFTMSEIMRSKWLEGVSYPQPYKSCSLKPPVNNEKMNEVEEVAVRQLQSFGISHAMMKKCPSGSRNNVIGTYRLCLYTAEKRALERQLQREADELDRKSMSRHLASQKSLNSKDQTTRSKFCTIL